MAQHDYDIANASGAVVRADLNSLFDAVASNNSGATPPGTTFAHLWWFDTSLNVLNQRNAANTLWITVAAKDASGWRSYHDGTELIIPTQVEVEAGVATTPRILTALRARQAADQSFDDTGTFLIFADGDATPAIGRNTSGVTGNTSPTTITFFDSSDYSGQWFHLFIGDNNTTIAGSLTRSGRAVLCVAGDSLIFFRDGTPTFLQIGGNVGMGNRYVPVKPGNAIGDWPISSIVVAADVDVSDDGVRLGAAAVVLRGSFLSSSGTAALFSRPNGSSDVSNAINIGSIVGGGATEPVEWEEELDDLGIFEAFFSGAWTSTINEAFVVAYII